MVMQDYKIVSKVAACVSSKVPEPCHGFTVAEKEFLEQLVHVGLLIHYRSSMLVLICSLFCSLNAGQDCQQSG